jgi:hypothetical protein
VRPTLAAAAALLVAAMAAIIVFSNFRSRRSPADPSVALWSTTTALLRRPGVIGLIAGASTFAAVAAGFSGMPLWAQLGCGMVAALAVAGLSILQPPRGPDFDPDPTTPPPVQITYAAGDLHIHPPRRPVSPERAPAPPPGYVGRHSELGRALHGLRRRKGSTPIVVVTGQPGVGKTAFALMVASQLSRREYSQHLPVRLGADSQQPLFPQQILRSLLIRLGVPAAELVGVELDALQGKYSGELGREPTLVILDDVAGAWQVETLKPPPGCAMIVIGIHELPGLLAQRAIPIRLTPLTTSQSLMLLADHLGTRRVGRQPLAALRIVHACGGLPLALVNVAGNLAKASQRHRPLREMAWLLSRERDRLRHLAIDGRGVNAALATSYALLNRDQQRTLQILGLFRTAEVHTDVVAAALSTTEATVSSAQATQALGELVDAGLLEVASPSADRWRLHNLVRLFAHGLADELPDKERREALGRAALASMRRVRGLRGTLTEPEQLADPTLAAGARVEIDRELAAGTAIIDRAAQVGVDLVAVLSGDLIQVLLDAITEWPGITTGHSAVRAIRTVAARRGEPLVVAQADFWLARHPQYSRQLQIVGSGLDPGELITIDVDGRNIGFVNANGQGRINTTITTPLQPFPPTQATAVGQRSGVTARATFR